MGLCSPGGVHSHIDHLYALLELCHREKFDRVFVHAFLDGRDTIFNSGASFITDLEKIMAEKHVGSIASLGGRFYAMDRGAVTISGDIASLTDDVVKTHLQV